MADVSVPGTAQLSRQLMPDFSIKKESLGLQLCYCRSRLWRVRLLKRRELIPIFERKTVEHVVLKGS